MLRGKCLDFEGHTSRATEQFSGITIIKDRASGKNTLKLSVYNQIGDAESIACSSTKSVFALDL
jgi:hypothetical protein